MRKRTIALIAVLVIILIIGIFAVQLYLEYSAAKNLSISVVKVGAQNVKVDSATVTLTLVFSNPSSTSLPPVQVNFSTYLAGKYIGNGTLPQTHIVGNNNVTQTLSFNVTYATVAGSVIRSLINGEYNITIIGKARVFLFFSLIPVNAGFTVVVICPGRTSVQNCTQTARLS